MTWNAYFLKISRFRFCRSVYSSRVQAPVLDVAVPEREVEVRVRLRIGMNPELRLAEIPSLGRNSPDEGTLLELACKRISEIDLSKPLPRKHH